jgi:hypothetical protein
MQMKTQVKRAAACVAAALAAPAMAANPTLRVDDIAAATGLTRSEVQMVVGARTPHPEYFTSYDRSQRRMVQVLGKERFRELMAGREIVLDNGQRLALLQR